MKNKILNFLGVKQVCCHVLSLACFIFWGCSNELLQNEVDTTMERADTRTEVLDIVTIGGVQYEVYDYLSFENTVGCVYATTTSHLEIKISYPTVNLRGLLVNKEWKDYYDYNFTGTNIYDWCVPIESIVEDQLYIDDKIYVPIDGSDTYLYLNIAANCPYSWSGNKERIWIRYYFTHKDYNYRYLMLENSEDDPQHYKACLAVPFNSSDIYGHISIGDVRISDSYGNWGPMYLDY